MYSPSPCIDTFMSGREQDTLDLGARLASVFHSGDCVTLTADLGVGKTTLARGIVRTFMDKEVEVLSPTFTLQHMYEASPNKQLWHYDLYRLEDPSELEEIGFSDTLSDIVLVEWPDIASDHLPNNRLDIHIAFSDGDGRAFTFYGDKDWEKRLKPVIDKI